MSASGQSDIGGPDIGEGETVDARAGRAAEASGLSPDGSSAALEDLLKQVADVSGPAIRGLGLRLRPGDTLRDGRLHILERIGEGGMGVVYKAHDAERGAPVALKTLSRLEPEGVYRLKNEFRALADVSHENLCRLFELFRQEGDWFFTMELISGERFDRWVRPAGQRDERRLRSGALQLCEAIAAIHQAGKLHRDLKPSNVLVTAEQRVVVLDFGLATERAGGGVGETLADGRISGTPAYMAPEQAAATSACTASDLYALGVMLFEGLTGRLPFSGNQAELYAAKQRDEAPRASSFATDVPDDLDALCARLLARAEDQRPSVGEVRALLLSSLDAESVSALLKNTPPARKTMRPGVEAAIELVGRERELAALRAAEASARAGEPVVMFVCGESGMGKSALISAFLEAQRGAGHAAIFSGRCNERENVPFKAFDALVDEVSRYLHRLSREEAISLLPRDVSALSRVFPVLARVPVVAEAPLKVVDDPQELRRRAFAAFGELIGRIRDRRPLLLVIDDLQWTDHDSVQFLRALLVDHEPAPVLLILSYRSEGAEQNPHLAAIREVVETNAVLNASTLVLAPLAESEARELAFRSLPGDDSERAELSQRIAREAGGSPFFVNALARHAASEGAGTALLSLSDVVSAHLGALTPEARRLLEVAALAGRPLALELLLSAAGASHDALDALRSQHLVRLNRDELGRSLECYHDRIRETALRELSEPERVARCQRLSDVLIGQDGAAPELLMICLEGARRAQLAAHYAALAAERAEQGMAFDRAAELYEKALALAPADAPERQQRKVLLAAALANAGHAKQAAETYLEAARGVTGFERVELRRRAADELLTGGYPYEGELLVREICREVGIKLPKSHALAMVEYGLMQAQLRLAGLKAPGQQQRAGLLSPEASLRLNVARTAARLNVNDPVYGFWAGTKYLLLAMAAGDAEHCAYALSHEGFNFTLISPSSEQRIAHIFALAEQYARAADSRELSGVAAIYQGVGFSFGRTMTTEEGRAHLLRGLELVRGARGMRFDIDAANLYLLRAPDADLPAAARRSALLVEEAFSLGRLWAASHMASFSTPVRLMVGDRAGALRHLEQAKQSWSSPTTLDWMNFSLLEAQWNLANYDGQPELVMASIERMLPLYERSPVRRGATGRAWLHSFRGTAALWLAQRPDTPAARRKALRELALEDSRSLQKLAAFHPYCASALGLRAGLALACGDRRAAVDLLRGYAQGAQPSHLYAKLDQLVARRRLGQVLSGEEGAELVASAEAAMQRAGVLDLEQTSRMLLPSCWLAEAY